jgi:DNA polymerase-3 subunit epsilon
MACAARWSVFSRNASAADGIQSRRCHRFTIATMLHDLDQPLACVDLETTGTSPDHARITEVGIVTVTDGVVEEWSTLVDPGCRIPPAIEALTGITSEMVAGAPPFAAIADEVLARLEGRLFVAHNARFDHGFLKAELERLDKRFAPRVLCTARLSRRLDPAAGRHSLDALIARHRLACDARHRALGDARVLVGLLAALRAAHPTEALAAAIAQQLAAPSLPAGLDPDALASLPEAPGVYLFRAADDAPLYVGKSIDLRARVRSHFSASLRSPKARRLATQIASIGHELCAGELGALLREAELVKQLKPVYNRRLRAGGALHALRWSGPGSGQPPRVVALTAGDAPDADEVHGAFRSAREAKRALLARAEADGLCRKRLGLEAGAGPCFARQLGRCRGACVGAEPALQHDLRLAASLASLRIARWPFPDRVGLREGRGAGTAVHVFDRWRFVATAADDDALAAAWRAAPRAFDLDVYRILERMLARRPPPAVVAPPPG